MISHMNVHINLKIWTVTCDDLKELKEKMEAYPKKGNNTENIEKKTGNWESKKKKKTAKRFYHVDSFWLIQIILPA